MFFFHQTFKGNYQYHSIKYPSDSNTEAQLITVGAVEPSANVVVNSSTTYKTLPATIGDFKVEEKQTKSLDLKKSLVTPSNFQILVNTVENGKEKIDKMEKEIKSLKVSFKLGQ